MRFIREITAKEENFRGEPLFPGNKALQIKRDFVEPEPIGTVILIPFRISGYGKDCDGSALATLTAIDNNFEETGWRPDCIGLYPSSGLIVSEQEYKDMVIMAKDAEKGCESGLVPSPQDSARAKWRLEWFRSVP